MNYITKDNIYTQSWNNLYEVISNNVTDPKSRGVKWIFSAFPDVKKPNFPGYPIITITPTDLSITNINLARDMREETYRYPIDIFSKSSQEVDELANSIIKALTDNEIELAKYGMKRMSIASSAITNYRIENNKIHNRTIIAEFKRID